MRLQSEKVDEYFNFTFQYRKRYEITCDFLPCFLSDRPGFGFNTASGMRSHATSSYCCYKILKKEFQYRKRYEITCDHGEIAGHGYSLEVSIPQAV